VMANVLYSSHELAARQRAPAFIQERFRVT
jgi:hypothetical protein